MDAQIPPRDWVRLARRWSRLFCLVVIAIGVVEIVVWVMKPAGIPAGSWLFNMKANAALCVMLLGAAAWLSLDQQGGWRRTVAASLAGVVLVIAVATLVEHATSRSLGLDLWLAADLRPDAGRMAAQAAANLSLFALAILSYRRVAGPGSWLCDASLLAAGVILEVMVAGYFDDAHRLYDFTGLSVPARQGGIAQMLLAGALVMGRTGRGAFTIFGGRGIGSAVMRVLIPVVVMLPVGMGRLRRTAGEFAWISASEVHAIVTVTQTVILGLTVYWFARHVNRLDERYRLERQRREEIERYVAVCAWTRRVRWEGKWVSIEEFLHRRFGLEVTHGISDDALAEQLASLEVRETPADDDNERRET